MSSVVPIHEFRAPGVFAEERPRHVISPFGVIIPTSAGDGERELPAAVVTEAKSGDALGHSVRVLRALDIRHRRVLAIDSGIGILPAVAARVGAERVIALEEDGLSVRVMKRIFALNGLAAEPIHGRAVRSSAGPVSVAEKPCAPFQIPAFDLDLIIEEERIDMLISTVGSTDPKLLRHLPPSVELVLIQGGSTEECNPARDLMMTYLIPEGFLYDPAVSEGDALLFRRSI